MVINNRLTIKNCDLMFFLCVGISHGECRGMGVLAIEGWNYYEVLARLCSLSLRVS
jgi:hypothetical protein